MIVFAGPLRTTSPPNTPIPLCFWLDGVMDSGQAPRFHFSWVFGAAFFCVDVKCGFPPASRPACRQPRLSPPFLFLTCCALLTTAPTHVAAVHPLSPLHHSFLITHSHTLFWTCFYTPLPSPSPFFQTGDTLDPPPSAVCFNRASRAMRRVLFTAKTEPRTLF